MQRYSVATRSVAAAVAGDVNVALWNPSSDRVLYVKEVWAFKTGATIDTPALYRITARGTPGTTTTPGIDNDWERLIAPPSGAVADTNYTVLPTKATPDLVRLNSAGATGASGAGCFIILSRPIKIIGGEGLGIAGTSSNAKPADVTFVWEE